MLRQKMLEIIRDVNAEVVEREDLVEAITIALLTRKNLFILGDTGQAKSYAINQFRKRIDGAVQFERLLSKQTDEEQLFGRLDLPALIQGTSKLVTTGKMPECHIAFLDELFKANDGVLNAMLTALNERKYTNEGITYDIPAISFFAASNEIPSFASPEQQILKPLYDRFDLKLVTEYIQDRDARLQHLREKQQGSVNRIGASIHLDELTAMQAEVTEVFISDAVNELMDNVLCALRDKKIHISDRKYFGYYPLAQAKAWLDGRDAVEPVDLLILRHYLWTAPEEREVITATLQTMCCDPLKNELDKLLGDALEAVQAFREDSAQSAAANTSPAAQVGKLRNELLHVYRDMKDLRAKAQTTQASASVDSAVARLEELNRQAHESAGRKTITLEQTYEIKLADGGINDVA